MQPWLPGHRPEGAALHVRNELDMEAPIESVWEWLVRPDRWSEFYDNARRGRIVQGQPPVLQLGTTFKWTTFNTPLTSTVEAYDQCRHLAWEFRTIGMHGYHWWQLERTDHGCHVVTEETQRGWVPRLFGRVIRPRMLRQHQLWLEGLEGAARGGSPGSGLVEGPSWEPVKQW